VTIPDGVIFMADGRLTRRDGVVIKDDAIKLVNLSATVFAIPAGVEFVTTNALGQLCRDVLPGDSCNTIIGKAKMAVGHYWEMFLHDMRAQGAENHPNNVAALLIGGLDSTGDLFLTQIIQMGTSAVQPLTSRVTGQIITVGEADPDQLAMQIASGASNHPWVAEEYLNPLVLFLIGTMRAGMMEASFRSPYIGGSIRCAIVRKGFPPLAFVCP